MRIQRYISIPKRIQPYISYLQFFISLSSGVISICIIRINQQQQGDIQSILIPFLIVLPLKLLLGINFFIRRRQTVNTVLENLTKISMGELIVPSIIKTLCYGGFILAILNINKLIVATIFIMNLILFEYVSLRMRYTRKVNFFNILIYTFLGISFLMLTQSYTFQSVSIHSILFIVIIGCILPISTFYLHREIFHIYQSSIDQIFIKQCIIDIVNFIIITILCYLLNHNLFEVFWSIIWQKPFEISLLTIISTINQYCIYQMLSKLDFKYIFISQLSGVLWYAIYRIIKDSFTIKIYLAALFSLLGLILILRTITVKNIERLINYIQIRNQHLEEQQ